MITHLCSFCSWKGHLSEKSSKVCPICGSGLYPLSGAARLAHNTKTVELQKEFIKACEVPADQDWSADRHCKADVT